MTPKQGVLSLVVFVCIMYNGYVYVNIISLYIFGNFKIGLLPVYHFKIIMEYIGINININIIINKIIEK